MKLTGIHEELYSTLLYKTEYISVIAPCFADFPCHVRIRDYDDAIHSKSWTESTSALQSQFLHQGFIFRMMHERFIFHDCDMDHCPHHFLVRLVEENPGWRNWYSFAVLSGADVIFLF